MNKPNLPPPGASRQSKLNSPTPHSQAAQRFADQATQDSPGLVREFLAFLRYNTKWWLLPIVAVLLLLSVLLMLGGTAFAPFIYTLF